MNPKLLLAALLLVVVVLLGSGTESSAKKLNSPKFSRKSDMEKRGNRNRRDLDDFQTQLFTATYLNISDSTTCSSFPCVSTVNDLWCISFCVSTDGKFENMVGEVVDCYKSEICGKDLTNFQLPNPVNISIAPGSYNGQCYLYGTQVTVTLKNETNSAQAMNSPTVGYYIFEEMYYDFTGLTLYCRPNSPSSSCNSGCCGNDLLTEVVCLVELITGSLGLPLNLLGCDCSCGGSFFGRREARAPTDSAPFQIPITVTQQEKFALAFIFGSEETYDYISHSLSQDTSVTFGTPLPTAYANDITSGVVTVFQSYDTFYALQYNYINIISNMLIQLYTTTCDKCSVQLA